MRKKQYIPVTFDRRTIKKRNPANIQSVNGVPITRMEKVWLTKTLCLQCKKQYNKNKFISFVWLSDTHELIWWHLANQGCKFKV